MKLILLLTMATMLIACSDSEQDRLRKQQQQLAQQQQSLNMQQQQLAQQQMAQQQYQQPAYDHQYQQPQYQQPIVVQQPAQAPVVVQQPSNGGSHVTDMLVGGLVGHALGNAMSNNNRSSSGYYDNRPRNVTNVTKNITINRSATSRPSSARLRK
jgi:hypothetical protein